MTARASARVLLHRMLMLPEEDEAPQSDHSVELELDSPFPTRRRRIAQVAVAAVMMGAAGLIAFAVAEHRRALDTERALEDTQSTQLQDGWKTLGAIAAHDARTSDTQVAAAAQPPAAPTVGSVPVPATTNIVIVNSPSQPAQRSASGASAPPVPSVATPTPAVGSATNSGSNTAYVPMPVPVLPDVTTDTNIPGQNLSLTPGSVPNPALPNGSSSSVPAAPGQPNTTNTATPNEPATPVGSVPASPPASGITP
ncbi:MAG: hypothetical protein ABJB12_15165 [Pseudomonadota bacterium]